MAQDLTWAVEGAPIGTWTTSRGTFDAMMQDVLTLAVDGTGWLRTRSAMRGIQLFPVMWRHPEPGVLELAMLFPDDDPKEPPFFETVRYTAVTVEHDVGLPRGVLQNTDDDVFWNLAGPIVLSSRVPKAPD
ncbi:MAG: hypothetical protein IPG45_21770 [Deltaproteobacteria bacterium]|nr:hypothetical protein [Deltaproteobacteria bacterium]